MTPTAKMRKMTKVWPAILLVLLTAMTLAAPTATQPELSIRQDNEGLAVTLHDADDIKGRVIMQLQNQDGKRYHLPATQEGGAWTATFPLRPQNATITAKAGTDELASTTYTAPEASPTTKPTIEVEGKPYTKGQARGRKNVSLKADGRLIATFEHDFTQDLATTTIEARTDGRGGVAANVPGHQDITLHVPLTGEECNVKVCAHALDEAGCTEENTRYAHPEPVNGTCPVLVNGTYAKDDPDGTDFLIQQSDIKFSTDAPTEGENVTLNVTVHNTGTTWADNVTILINDTSTGTLLKNHTVANFSAGTQETITTWINATIGPHGIQATIDPEDEYVENNETNNDASRWLNVTAWHTIAGNATHKHVLADDDNAMHEWPLQNTTAGNLYAADTDTAIDWYGLQALGRKADGTTATQDLAEADTALGLAGHHDSITLKYGENESAPRTTKSFTIHGATIDHIPITNSTNTSSFQTGILWDATQGTEYDGTQPLVFITAINPDTQGAYGTYDYEIAVPSTLQDTEGTTGELAFYLEIP